jgi:hypothetical protein
VRGEDVLHVLQDVEWVVGSFVANSEGELLLSLMPPEFRQDELERTTSRLASIVRCAELCELGVEQCDFSLNRYQLLLRHFRGGLLCIMVEAPVNRRALDMATRIALQSLPDLVATFGPGTEPPVSDVPAPRREPTSEAPAAPVFALEHALSAAEEPANELSLAGPAEDDPSASRDPD